MLPPQQEEDLIERLKQAADKEIDTKKKEDLVSELKIISTTKSKFDKVEQLYEAHRNSTLPLPLLKVELEMNMRDLMPKCPLEELGGY